MKPALPSRSDRRALPTHRAAALPITRTRRDTDETAYLAVGTPVPAVQIGDPAPGAYSVRIVVPGAAGEGRTATRQSHEGSCLPLETTSNTYGWKGDGTDVTIEFRGQTGPQGARHRSGTSTMPDGATVTWTLTWVQ